MSDEPTYEDEPEMDPAEFEGDEVNPRADVDPFESDPEGEGDGPEYEPVDNRADFLDWFDQHFHTAEATGSREIAIWCPEWWLHPEVNARLWALFRAHQAVELSLSLDALSDWWLNHWDRHKLVLFDAQTGPFKDCDMTQGHLYQRTRGRHGPAVPAPLPPDGWHPPAT
ncbi:uncharacterized protein DUF4913 [Frondihabitans sp. PhB188]|uniref:DUF4913 domain-containing protein n=1 Tax=Frondihabitans sp. PhB188 TaxID=2485200 RepID=UPI000F477750|nr:DUF4913 domain-containing protein [Frondihabitans sp. PhB188]ROQ30876.1 uncharacterized protein DUF4913 [Frondihabitans sp. PhB188]